MGFSLAGGALFLSGPVQHGQIIMTRRNLDLASTLPNRWGSWVWPGGDAISTRLYPGLHLAALGDLALKE